MANRTTKKLKRELLNANVKVATREMTIEEWKDRYFKLEEERDALKLRVEELLKSLEEARSYDPADIDA